jgi:hypothetical protein
MRLDVNHGRSPPPLDSPTTNLIRLRDLLGSIMLLVAICCLATGSLFRSDVVLWLMLASVAAIMVLLERA